MEESAVAGQKSDGETGRDGGPQNRWVKVAIVLERMTLVDGRGRNDSGKKAAFSRGKERKTVLGLEDPEQLDKLIRFGEIRSSDGTYGRGVWPKWTG